MGNKEYEGCSHNKEASVSHPIDEDTQGTTKQSSGNISNGNDLTC